MLALNWLRASQHLCNLFPGHYRFLFFIPALPRLLCVCTPGSVQPVSVPATSSGGGPPSFRAGSSSEDRDGLGVGGGTAVPNLSVKRRRDRYVGHESDDLIVLDDDDESNSPGA